MRVRTFIIILLIAAMSVSAQESKFSIGIRGGAISWLLHSADPSTTLRGDAGGSGMLDIRFSYYGNVSRFLDLGFQVGLGAGYCSSTVSG